MIQSQENFYRKINKSNSTPKSININQYNKTINYKISNTNINNNITNFIYPFSPIDKFNKKFSRESEGSSHNSSDIKFEDSPSSLKDQILSPEDEDLYLNKKREIFSSKVNNNNNNNILYDVNYFLNYDINPEKFAKINNVSKKILILDLDETLVHSSFYPFNSDDETDTNSDIFFTILFNNKYYDVYVLLRPFFHEFLEKMSKAFDIYIFTASIKEYAEPLLIKLDKKNLIKKKLFRENCTLSEDNKYIKDLNILNENLKNVILLDNNPNSFRYNKCNGIPIKTWHFDQNDKELIKIIPFLNFLSTVDDVREYIPKIISNDEIDYNKVYNILNKNITIKKCEKKLINIIRKNASNIKNKNKNKGSSNSKIKLSYPQLFTNNMSIKYNNQNKEINFFPNDDEENNNKIFASSINFNKFEERKNNNIYTLNTNTSKYFHSPGTINFREPFGETTKNKISKNKTILYQTNLNMNKLKKTEKNKYVRSKSTYNFNDLSDNINNKYSTINFNLINNNLSNKNKSSSSTNTIKNTKIKNYKSFNNDKHSCYNNYIYHHQKINEERAALFFENNEHYLFTLNQNDNYLNNNYINNNMINNNISNNKSLEQKMSLSSRMMKIKSNNKKQRNNQSKNDNNKINQIKQQKDNNLFSYKNFTNKNNIENNKNEESEFNIKYNNINIPGLDYNKIHNFKSKKSNSKKAITGRNNDNLLKRKNMDKFISVSKTTEFNKDNINNNINYISNNYIHPNKSDYMNKINNNICTNNNNINSSTNTLPKKMRCSTLNSHHMNTHHKKMKEIIEENKNNTMEITKNIKSRFFFDETKAVNLKGIPRKNKSMNNKKSNINYNKSKKNINREINLLNKFLKEFNNSKKNKNSKIINEQNDWKEFNTQRESRYVPNKNIFNYNCDSIYNQKQMNKEELIKKEKNDKYQEDNTELNYYRKSQNYKAKGNSNYLRKKMKNINYENNYMNFKNQNNNINNNELVSYTNTKNMKYPSMDKSSGKNKSQKNSEMLDKKGTLINNKNNYLMKLYYSYANNKS